MPTKKIKRDVWLIITLAALCFYALFLLYPLINLLKTSVMDDDNIWQGLQFFQKFFSKPYYMRALMNSFKVSLSVTAASVLIATPLAYIMANYQIKLKRVLEITILISSMSAPFIGAYAWIMLLGRNGAITNLILDLTGVRIPDIYGFKGIVVVMSFQLFSLVYMFVSSAFKNMDASLLEASESLGCTRLKKMFRVVLPLVVPTLFAGALMVFMRTFADYGTPRLIGEGYNTLPVVVYEEFMGEIGSSDSFAAAISIIAILITTSVFLIQKLVANRKAFTINSLHPVHPRKLKGAGNVFAHLYCYLLVGFAIMPQCYVVYTSFLKANNKIFVGGYSLDSYARAFDEAGRTIGNTYLLAIIAIAAIVIIAVLIAYVTVRRRNPLSNLLDVICMFPETVAGSILGIALLVSFNKRPLLLSGGAFIMILSYTIRRLPYTIRSSSAILHQISPSIEEASISLGAGNMKTFFKVTTPMMMPGVIAGAILSWIMIITELSTSLILYVSGTKTITIEIYSQIIRGNDAVAAALSSILTFSTIIALAIFFKLSGKKDVQL